MASKPAKPAKPQTSFDSYCPCCRVNIGWELLAKKFADEVFHPKKTLKEWVTCPHCDTLLRCELLVDFQLTEKL